MTDPWALALEHKGFAVTVARGYLRPGLDLADLTHDGLIGLRRAAETYEPGRGSFTNYSRWFVHQAIRQAIGRLRLAELGDIDVPAADPELGRCDGERCDAWLVTLKPVEATILRLRFGLDGGDGLSQNETARAVGRAQSGVFALEKRALAKLRAALGGDR